MDANLALVAAQRVAYRPDWQLSFRYEDATHISMTTDFSAPDTNREQAFRSRPHTVYPGRTETIPVDDLLTESHLHERIFAVILQRELHEMLESYRVERGGEAPWHPHRRDTVDVWAQAGPRILADANARVAAESATWFAEEDELFTGRTNVLDDLIGRVRRKATV